MTSSPLPPPVQRTQPGRPAPSIWKAFFAAAAVVVSGLLLVGYGVYRGLESRGGWRQSLARWSHVAAARRVSSKDAAAGAPIVINPAATLARDDRAHALLWAGRTMLGEGYTRAGQHAARWDAPARAFIDRALPWWAGHLDPRVTATGLVLEADGVLKLGCDDPVVLYLAGRAKAEADPQSPDASVCLARAVEGFRARAYPRGVACVAAAEFIKDCARRRDGTGQSDPVKKLWLEWFGQSLRDGSYPPEDQTVLTGQLAIGGGVNLFHQYRQECCRAVEAAGDKAVAPWLRLWLSGERHIDDGWDARGTDYANKVTATGWQGFEKALAEARRDLVASWQLNPRRPEAATAMIVVAMAESGRQHESERLWFDRATAAQLDYHPAYAKMIYALYPRWGGSHLAMTAFGLACARTARYDTGVPLEFHHALLSLGWDEQDDAYPFRSQPLSRTLEEVFAGYEAEPERSGYRVLYHGWHARAAALAGRYAEARDLLREVDYRLAPPVAEELGKNETPAGFVGRIAVLGGAGGKLVHSAEGESAAGHADKALHFYEMALEVLGQDALAVDYLRGKVAVLGLEQLLAGGDWTSFQPVGGNGGTPLGWTGKLGRWQVNADGSLTGQAGASGLMLVSDAHVGPDFEVRGEMDFLPKATSEVQSGVVFGYPDFGEDDWRSLRLKRNGREGSIVVLSQHWHDGAAHPIAVPDRNTFVLQSWHGGLSVAINGQVMFRDQALAQGRVDAADALVGLGGYSHQGNGFGVQYRGLQIRRLAAPPVALTDGTVQTAGPITHPTIYR